VDVELGMNSDCLVDELDAFREVCGEDPDGDCSVTAEDWANALRAPKRVRDAEDKMRMTLTMLPSRGRGDREHGGASWGGRMEVNSDNITTGLNTRKTGACPAHCADRVDMDDPANGEWETGRSFRSQRAKNIPVATLPRSAREIG
jgi:hypothetical protein